MQRGGSRPGAGRPRGSAKLTSNQRDWVGARCEQLWQEAIQKKIEEAHRPVSDRLAAARTAMPERPDFKSMTAQEREEAFRKWSQTTSMETYLDDFDFEIREIKGTPIDVDEVVPVFHVEVRKPQGVQPAIKEKVRSEVANRYGITVSIGTVEKCWKAFRKLAKEVSREAFD